MATIVNNPGSSESADSGAGWAIAIVLIVLLALLVFFGLPALRNGPATDGGNTNINVPPADVNVNVPTPDVPGDTGTGGAE